MAKTDVNTSTAIHVETLMKKWNVLHFIPYLQAFTSFVNLLFILQLHVHVHVDLLVWQQSSSDHISSKGWYNFVYIYVCCFWRFIHVVYFKCFIRCSSRRLTRLPRKSHPLGLRLCVIWTRRRIGSSALASWRRRITSTTSNSPHKSSRRWWTTYR